MQVAARVKRQYLKFPKDAPFLISGSRQQFPPSFVGFFGLLSEGRDGVFVQIKTAWRSLGTVRYFDQTSRQSKQ